MSTLSTWSTWKFSDLFLSSDRRTRPIWRAVIFLVFGAAIIIPTFIVTTVVVGPEEVLDNLFLQILVQGIAMLGASMAAAWIMYKVFDELTFRALGLWFYPRWWKDLALGLAVGGGLLSIVVATLVATGSLRWRPEHLSAGELLAALGWYLLVLGIAATGEEVLFRGYFFQKLVESFGAVGATLVLSIAFGLAHLGNPEAGWFSLANTVLMGILLAVAYLRTRALWFATGLHISWNYIMGAVYSLPISGLILPTQPFEPVLTGPRWFTGGDYGPEGSVLVTLVALGGTLWLARTRLLEVLPEQRSALGWHPIDGSER